MFRFDSAKMKALQKARLEVTVAEAWDAFLELPLGGARLPSRDEAMPLLLETRLSCARYGIDDVDSALDLMLVSLLIGRDVLAMEEFLPLLNDSLFHPRAKARQIVMAFMAIGRMQGR